MASPSPAPIPPKLGAEAEFDALRAALTKAGYNEPAICERLGLQSLSQFRFAKERGAEPPAMDPVPDALDVLIRLFLKNYPVPRQIANVVSLDAFQALGLIQHHIADPGLLSATVILYPLRGLYIVSDRPTSIEGGPGRAPDDFVYPALIPNTELFLDLIPSGPCDAFLDLCAGTGIAALLAARHGAAHAYSYDITHRSTVFAEFNRRLNSVPNFTASEGDLYAPAGGLTFDRIVAHPPYVPVYRPHLIFDSGGQDGEQIVRRIIEGLPVHLRPGGRFYALTMGSDRDLPFEQRLREWLGPGEADFDVAFVKRLTRTTREWAAESVIGNKGAVTDIPAWREFFDGLHVKALVYGLVMIQRRAQTRPVFTVRRQTGPTTGPLEHAWLFDWETAAVSQDPADLLDLRPCAVPGIRLRVEHAFESGSWVPSSYLLETEYPFNTELAAQAWTAHLFSRADGTATVPELLATLKADGALRPDTPVDAFAEMLATLISGGFLKV